MTVAIAHRSTNNAYAAQTPAAAGSASPNTAAALQATEQRGQIGQAFLGGAGANRPAVQSQALAGALSGSGKLSRGVRGNYQEPLKTATARAIPEGQQPAAGSKSLTFSPEEAERVRNAPTPEAATQEVMKLLCERAGVAFPGGKNGMRTALNKLLGTNIRKGRRKNKASKKIFAKLASSIAESLRAPRDRPTGGPAPTTGTSGTPAQRPVTSGGGSYGSPSTSSSGSYGSAELPSSRDNPGYGATYPSNHNCLPPSPPPAPPAPAAAQPATVDITDFVAAAQKASELSSPLIFDLAGGGLRILKGERVPVDLDGDGQDEMVTDLDNGLGLLVFDAVDHDAMSRDGASRDYFGDGTDLSGYGIHSPRADGRWDDGFAALRALCERFELVHGDKQHLDAQDLAFLEAQVGLRMRVDGIYGVDRTFAEVGVTRINLGDPTKVDPIEAAAKDRFGNKLMHQVGATFVVHGEERRYADLWFAVTQRAPSDKTKSPQKTSTVSRPVQLHHAVVR